MNNMGKLSWYLGCTFKRGGAKGVVKMTKTAFVESLIDHFDIQFETETPAYVEYDLGPNRFDRNESDSP